MQLTESIRSLPISAASNEKININDALTSATDSGSFGETGLRFKKSSIKQKMNRI